MMQLSPKLRLSQRVYLLYKCSADTQKLVGPRTLLLKMLRVHVRTPSSYQQTVRTKTAPKCLLGDSVTLLRKGDPSLPIENEGRNIGA